MKIVTWEPKKFRWEYSLEATGFDSIRVTYNRWFLYHEDIKAPVEVRSMAEAFEYLKDRNHPAWQGLNNIMFYWTGNEIVTLMPYEPVQITPELLKMFPSVVERVQYSDYERKVWDLVNGHVWLHVPGDTAL